MTKVSVPISLSSVKKGKIQPTWQKMLHVRYQHYSERLIQQPFHPDGPRTTKYLSLTKTAFTLLVSRLGYGYSGPFRALSGLKRKSDVATGFIRVPESTAAFGKLLVHPAELDAAIQSMILAYCYPGDTSLRTIQLPTAIDCIRFNIPFCETTNPGSKVQVRSSMAPGDNGDINGDVEVYCDDGSTTVI